MRILSSVALVGMLVQCPATVGTTGAEEPGDTAASIPGWLEYQAELAEMRDRNRALEQQVSRLRNQGMSGRAIVHELGSKGYTRDEILEKYNALAPLPQNPLLIAAIRKLKDLQFTDEAIGLLLRRKFSDMTSDYYMARASGPARKRRSRIHPPSAEEKDAYDAYLVAAGDHKHSTEVQEEAISTIKNLKRQGFDDNTISAHLALEYDNHPDIEQWMSLVP